MLYDIGTTSCQGNRKSNQDRLDIVESESAILLVVADGMGGHACGELAAEATVDCAIREFNVATMPIHDPSSFLKDVIMHAHHDVITLSGIYNPPLKSRTTCVICMVQQGVAYWAHVGDSRVYLIRDGQVVSRTVDHSQVELLYQQGKITAQQKLKHPHRNLVTQCIGSRTYGPQPDFSSAYPLHANDILLLCSDGLWGALSEKQMCEFLETGNLLRNLESMASAAAKASAPHADNISIAALRWLSPAVTATSESEGTLQTEPTFETAIKNIYASAAKK